MSNIGKYIKRNHSCYIFNDVINVKIFEPNNTKITKNTKVIGKYFCLLNWIFDNS